MENRHFNVVRCNSFVPMGPSDNNTESFHFYVHKAEKKIIVWLSSTNFFEQVQAGGFFLKSKSKLHQIIAS